LLTPGELASQTSRNLIISDQYTNEKDTVEQGDINAYLKARIDSLYSNGHWLAGINSVEKIDSNQVAEIYSGQKFTKFSIYQDSSNSLVFETLKLQQFDHPGEWESYGARLAKYFGNQGYPLAKIFMDSIDIVDDEMVSYLNINIGPRIYLDSIYLKGDLRLRKKYLNHYLGYYPGEYYREDRISKTEDLLKALPFVKLNKKPELKFLGEYASLHLDLNRKNASRLDFLIGINPSTEDGEQRFFLSLDLEAELINQLNQGEYISFSFARLQRGNQEVKIKVRYPYPFDLPIAINGSFQLFRNSLTFQDVDSEIGMAYLINSTDNIGLSWEFDSSRLINIDSMGIVNSGKLPESLDVSNNGLSLYGTLSRYNNQYNPSKGWAISGKFKASTKEIIENNTIKSLESETLDFSTAYDTLDKIGFQFAAELKLNKYFEIGENFSLHASLKNYWLFSDLTLYNNELQRIGGNRILKGFDEEAFLAEIYFVPGISFNLILDERSFLSIPFIEYGIFKDQDGVWQRALGLGAGLNFQTKAGLLNFSLATGKFRDTPFNIRNPKVHIGFLSLF